METAAKKDKNKEKIIHILLADDDFNIVFINQMVLEEKGYVVYPAHSGREAIALIEQYRGMIDVIVTDCLMPGMSGIELAAEANRLIPGTPVILYTGKAEYVDEKQIDEAGVSEVIVKPFKMKDLDIMIREMLKQDNAE